MIISIILIVLLIFPFLASGMWISVAAGVIGVLLLLIFVGGDMLTMIGPLQFNIVNEFTWTPLPLFVFMGEILLKSGLSDRLYRGASRLTCSLSGSLLHTNIVSCALFAAISGSSVATAATVGSVAIPELEKRGYNRRMTFGSLAAGGTLGILIPPSIPMIVYGAFTNVSVGFLFMAGVIPGIILAILFMLCIVIWAKISIAVKDERKVDFRLSNIFYAAIDLWPIAILMIVVLGSMYAGVTTPTEAAALGCIGALALSLLFRQLTFDIVKEAAINSARLTSWVLLIVIGAQVMSMGLSFLKVPAVITEAVVNLGLNRYIILSIVFILYIILGMFLEAMSMMVLTLPVVFPVIISLGFDPLWFGVFMTIVVEMAQITPPVGINLFIISGLTNDKYLDDVIKGVLPFVACQIILVVLLVIFPSIALWLPLTMVAE